MLTDVFLEVLVEDKTSIQTIALYLEALHDVVPSNDILDWHHLPSLTLCLVGCDVEESLDHLFIYSPYTKNLWYGCLDIILPNFEFKSRYKIF